MRRRISSLLSWLVVFALMAQALAFGLMPVAEAADAPFDAWQICAFHGDPAPAGAPARGGKKSARHDPACTLCAAGCCAAPMALAAAGVRLPTPLEPGRIEHPAVAAPRLRSVAFALPCARGPPALS